MSGFCSAEHRICGGKSDQTKMAALNVVHADILVPAGGGMALGASSTDLNCGDVTVAGTLLLQKGSLNNVRNLSIAAGGSVVAGSGVITLSGNRSDAGSFSAGVVAVNFVDAPTCLTSSTISGTTTFATFSLISTGGKLYRVAAGSTQTYSPCSGPAARRRCCCDWKVTEPRKPRSSIRPVSN